MLTRLRRESMPPYPFNKVRAFASSATKKGGRCLRCIGRPLNFRL
jgi:hypothetical protein